jgi:hypothetical protein
MRAWIMGESGSQSGEGLVTVGSPKTVDASKGGGSYGGTYYYVNQSGGWHKAFK